MIIGIPKEIKANENRVSMTPYNVKTLADDGHDILFQTGAGIRSGFPDEEYLKHGANWCPMAPKHYQP